MNNKIAEKLAKSAGNQSFLADLFVKSITTADICDKHKRNQANAARAFLEYMAPKPPVGTWEEWLMSDHIGEYLDWCAERGLKPSTLRGYANAFRLVNRTVYRKTRQPKAEVQAYLPKRQPLPVKNHLVLEKLCMAITEARSEGNLRAEIGFTLGGLMGLRLEEVAYLCKSDYCDVEQSLFIYDSKTLYSTRTLPVPESCRSVLRRAFAYRDVLPRHRDPRNALYWSHEPISNAMRDVMKALYKKTGDPAFDGRVKPMNARRSFKNLCTAMQIDWWLVESWMGHKLPGEAEAYTHLRVTRNCLPEIRCKALKTLACIGERLDREVKNYMK